jgi:hypothetical protein
VLVDRAVLLDVEIARRNVGLGLVVVVIRDEVFDGVVRKELAELRVKLSRKRLVGREDERGRPVWAITLAIVYVLPEPVTPRSVWNARPSPRPSTKPVIASG